MARLSLPVLAILLAAALPVAAAFPASDAEVDLAYAAGATPVVLASGAIDADGVAQGGLYLSGLADTTLGPLARLDVVTPDPILGVRNETFRDVLLVIHSGTLAWVFEDGASAQLNASLDYGLGVALPEAPFGEEGAAPPGFMLMGPDLQAGLSWAGRSADMVPLDATVSIQDRTGKAYAGWDHKRINEDAQAQDAAAGAGETSLLHIEGAFSGTLAAEALAAGVGEDATMALAVRASGTDRLAETLDIFARIGSELSGGEGAQGAEALDALEAFSGLLNGAILIISGGEETPPEPKVATLNGESVDVGPFALMRSQDLALEWQGSEMRVQGTSTVAVTKDGFAVASPATVGIFPIVSLVLWVVAIGAMVFFVVKRPPKAKTAWTIRLASAGVNLLVFLVVFWLWDGAFAETFGTSFLTKAGEVGFSSSTAGQLGTLLGLQMLPWSVAALFFALPVRIAVGVGLRYLGKGKSLKGVATASGLISLAVFGPIYALWLLDMLIGQLVAGVPAMMAGP